MEKDQRDLLREFNAHHVRYLVIGGYAFSYYTQPRATKDLDVFIENSAENTALVFAALARFGAPVADMSPRDFQDGGSVYQVGVPPSRIDILQTIEAIEFAETWEASEAGTTATAFRSATFHSRI